MDKTEPYAIIEGLGTSRWLVEIWTEQYNYIPTDARGFGRKAAAERWARKRLAHEKKRIEHERERAVVTI